MSTPRRLPNVAVSVLAAMLAGGAPAAAARDARDVPVIDQHGAAFTLRDLGRPTVVTFVDLHCTDACALAQALMGAFGVVRSDARFHSTFAYVLDARGLPVRTIPLSTGAGAELIAALRGLAGR